MRSANDITGVAPTPADMDTIAQEWFTIVSDDSDALLLAAFIWPDLTCGRYWFNQLSSECARQACRDWRRHICGKMPTYASSFNSLNYPARLWDGRGTPSQPYTPISVDIYDGATKLAQFAPIHPAGKLLNAGIGNGQHGFTFNLPSSVRNGSPIR